MKTNTVLVLVAVLLVVLFFFRYSGYEQGECTSKNDEYAKGMRCHDQNGKVNLSGPFCREKCVAPSTWK